MVNFGIDGLLADGPGATQSADLQGQIRLRVWACYPRVVGIPLTFDPRASAVFSVLASVMDPTPSKRQHLLSLIPPLIPRRHVRLFEGQGQSNVDREGATGGAKRRSEAAMSDPCSQLKVMIGAALLRRRVLMCFVGALFRASFSSMSRSPSYSWSDTPVFQLLNAEMTQIR